MNGSIIIKNANIVSSGKLVRADVIVRDGFISLDRDSSHSDFQVIDAAGKLLTYSLADVHVHFREPGNPEKETIRTGSLAAARGGYTSVCAMPNLSPAPDSLETLAVEQGIIDSDSLIDVRPYATITLGRKGYELVDFASLKGHCVAFSDDGSGVQNDEIMLQAMKLAAENDVIIAAHCEDNSLLTPSYIDIPAKSEWGQVERDLELAKISGCHYHVCHISTKESVSLIREAKKAGVNVTCETAPHYLLLNCENRPDDGRFKMNPPLRCEEDRRALIEGLRDGTIDMIATDHAPHTAQQKSKGLEGSAMGIVGLETAFPLLYTALVRTGCLTLERLLELMCGAPRRIFRLGGGVIEEGAQADLALFDIENEYVIDSRKFASKGKSTPFDGWKVTGRCVLTVYKGNIVFDETVCL